MGDAWLNEVVVRDRSIGSLRDTIGESRLLRVEGAARQLLAALRGRRIVNINSTPTGGGAAEMLQNLVAYVRGLQIDCRWLVIGGDAVFFTITKRIHNRVYGFSGDSGALGDAERRHYERVQSVVAEQLVAFLRPDDLVLIHDPQPLGLAPAIRDLGARTVWRCHIGTDYRNEFTEEAWDFLRPYLDRLDAYVFTRASFAPTWLDPSRVVIIPPSIDPSSPKNRPLDGRTVHRILAHCGLQRGEPGPTLTFVRADGSRTLLRRHADVLQSGPPAPPDAPLVVQVSRWDRMKDMGGVMQAFADNLAQMGDAHLALIGPAITGYADDPTAAEVLVDSVTLWRTLPHEARGRIHLACLPMTDPEENALMINAVQRQAAVITQLSLAEGFGLTVAEAMWKSKPVIASRVGGIQEQVIDGTGVLVPSGDHDAAAAALAELLADPSRRAAMGRAAHERAQTFFLPDRHLLQYGELFLGLCDR
ncbi:MAG TPA: glycosyltransferase [Mycobacteriales bacterium]|nr:glycosyltransferase [Mycobacteriales bacterium]